MKKILSTLLILIVIQQSLAQAEGPQIKLAVLGPELSIEGLTQNHKNKIKTKVERMVSRYGIISTNFIEDFIIYPEFEIFVDDSTPSTYGTIHNIEGELTLKAENLKTKSSIVSPFPFKVKGTSRNGRDDAITKAIGKIKTNGPEVERFIAEIKQKVVNHYLANCNAICEKAGKLISLGQPDGAILLLYSIPQNLSENCNDRVAKLLDYAYKAYSSQQCNGIINEAQKAVSEGKTKYAKSLLVLIGKESSCYENAQQIINGIDEGKDPTSPEKVKQQMESRKTDAVKQVAVDKGKIDDKEMLCAKRLRTDCD